MSVTATGHAAHARPCCPETPPAPPPARGHCGPARRAPNARQGAAPTPAPAQEPTTAPSPAGDCGCATAGDKSDAKKDAGPPLESLTGKLQEYDRLKREVGMKFGPDALRELDPKERSLVGNTLSNLSPLVHADKLKRGDARTVAFFDESDRAARRQELLDRAVDTAAVDTAVTHLLEQLREKVKDAPALHSTNDLYRLQQVARYQIGTDKGEHPVDQMSVHNQVLDELKRRAPDAWRAAADDNDFVSRIDPKLADALIHNLLENGGEFDKTKAPFKADADKAASHECAPSSTSEPAAKAATPDPDRNPDPDPDRDLDVDVNVNVSVDVDMHADKAASSGQKPSTPATAPPQVTDARPDVDVDVDVDLYRQAFSIDVQIALRDLQIPRL